MNLISEEIKLDFKDVMILPRHGENINSRSEVNIEREFIFPYGTVIAKPIINANMDTIGTRLMAYSLFTNKCFTTLHKYFTVEEIKSIFAMASMNELWPKSDFSNYIWPTFGLEKDFSKIDEVVKFSNNLHFDVANGYLPNFIKLIKSVREKYPKHAIMAGTVCTFDGFEQLAEAGANVIRVGIGGGSTCITRALTGIGYPQWSAVADIKDKIINKSSYIECAPFEKYPKDHSSMIKIQEELPNVYIVSDGGCTVPADIVKALGAGADMVMLGGMLAGTDESTGNIVNITDSNGTSYTKCKKYYGMASKTAQEKHKGKVSDYASVEGKEVYVPYKGPVQNTLNNIFGGLRSACTYLGIKNIEDINEYCQFIKVNKQLNDVFGN